MSLSYTERHCHTLDQLADCHQRIRELEREVERLRAVATRDPLTGALNRRGLSEFMEAAVKRAYRSQGSTVSAILVDLDYFKALNDAHGHDVGDQVLCRAVEAMQGQVRASDALGRWGGEEFLVVAEEGLAGAMELAERLRWAIEWGVDSHGLPGVTASFGVAEFDGTVEDAPMASTVKCADMALYQAKADGRNRVRRFTERRTA